MYINYKLIKLKIKKHYNTYNFITNQLSKKHLSYYNQG